MASVDVLENLEGVLNDLTFENEQMQGSCCLEGGDSQNEIMDLAGIDLAKNKKIISAQETKLKVKLAENTSQNLANSDLVACLNDAKSTQKLT